MRQVVTLGGLAGRIEHLEIRCNRCLRHGRVVLAMLIAEHGAGRLACPVRAGAPCRRLHRRSNAPCRAAELQGWHSATGRLETTPWSAHLQHGAGALGPPMFPAVTSGRPRPPFFLAVPAARCWPCRVADGSLQVGSGWALGAREPKVGSLRVNEGRAAARPYRLLACLPLPRAQGMPARRARGWSGCRSSWCAPAGPVANPAGTTATRAGTWQAGRRRRQERPPSAAVLRLPAQPR
jgi:hypothetical protein